MAFQFLRFLWFLPKVLLQQPSDLDRTADCERRLMGMGIKNVLSVKSTIAVASVVRPTLNPHLTNTSCYKNPARMAGLVTQRGLGIRCFERRRSVRCTSPRFNREVRRRVMPCAG